MAEALLRTRMTEAGTHGLEVRSVGTAAVGGPATPAAVEVLADRGIDLSGHVSRPLTDGSLASADLVVAMTRRHETVIGSADPAARSRTFLAGEVARLGGQVGPRGLRLLADWVRALDGARGGHFTTGRVADEVADPYGESVETYRDCADRLDGLCTALARLLATPN